MRLDRLLKETYLTNASGCSDRSLLARQEAEPTLILEPGTPILTAVSYSSCYLFPLLAMSWETRQRRTPETRSLPTLFIFF